MSSKLREAVAPVAPSEQDEVRFPYSLELVATIAAHFVNANTNEKQACERAIRLLNAARETVQAEEVVIRSRKTYDQVPTELGFLDGIYWIVGYRREGDATKAFRDYLRINLRRSRFPRKLTRDDVTALLNPLPEDAEDSEIEKLMANYRANGFTQGEIQGIKQQRDRWLKDFQIPFRNSEKGKRGGRPKGSKKKQKKSLART